MFEKNEVQPQHEIFSIYSPTYIDLTSIEYITRYLSNITRDVRNPIFKNKWFRDDVIKRRAALKVSLTLP
ncbi:unnamed protein product [marine sediment metagenome]|uniref:Uncharacterized protein n=1 Tax=marine sediment metagenome TaxID=412755 RepID=X1JEJ1_9ZZZZ